MEIRHAKHQKGAVRRWKARIGEIRGQVLIQPSGTCGWLNERLRGSGAFEGLLPPDVRHCRDCRKAAFRNALVKDQKLTKKLTYFTVVP